jgi:hypothetical protein
MEFLTRTQTQQFLAADPDGFIARLGPYDLMARHVRSREEYKAVAVNSASAWNPDEKDYLWRQAQLAQEFLETTIYAGLPWRFAKAYYEDGLPHTRLDIIFLSGVADASTLVHEMVHVGQKLRGPQIPPGYVPTNQVIANMRANPDTDRKVWYKDGKPAGAFFGPHPTSIMDIHEYSKHPFEAEAYAVEERFVLS